MRLSRLISLPLVGALVAGLVATGPAPAAAQEIPQPIWQPAVYCAAVEAARADILSRTTTPLPAWVGTPEAAADAARTYTRIAAEALDCPPRATVEAMVATARVGVEHRIALAASYDIGPEVSILPLTSETQMVCALNFEPALLAAAHAARGPICGWTE